MLPLWWFGTHRQERKLSYSKSATTSVSRQSLVDEPSHIVRYNRPPPPQSSYPLDPPRNTKVTRIRSTSDVADAADDLQALDFPDFYYPHEAYIVPIRPITEPLPATMGLADLQASLKECGNPNRLSVSTYLQDLNRSDYLRNVIEKTARPKTRDPAFTEIDMHSRVVTFQEMEVDVMIMSENEDEQDPEVSSKFDISYLYKLPEFANLAEHEIAAYQEAELTALGARGSAKPPNGLMLSPVISPTTDSGTSTSHQQPAVVPSIERVTPTQASSPPKIEQVPSLCSDRTSMDSRYELSPPASTYDLPPWRQPKYNQYAQLSNDQHQSVHSQSPESHQASSTTNQKNRKRSLSTTFTTFSDIENQPKKKCGKHAGIDQYEGENRGQKSENEESARWSHGRRVWSFL